MDANARVLIVRLGAMGDVLHALPAVALLRSALPGARIGWAVERRWRELLCAPETELCGERGPGRPLVDELHLADTRGWRKQIFTASTRAEFTAFRRGLRGAGFHAVIDLQGAIKSAVVARLAGAATVCGFRHPREGLAATLYHSAVGTHATHVIDQNADLVRHWLRLAGAATDLPLPPVAELLPRCTAAERHIDATLTELGIGHQPFAILTPGAGWAAKQWPATRYGQLAAWLGRRGLRSLVNYGPGEEPLALETVRTSEGSALPLFTSISQLLALTRRATLFVGGDTGPMHLAAALGIKTLALFGATDPARNGPYWANTSVLRDPASVTSYRHSRSEDLGLQRLTVEQVTASAEALLG